MHAILILGRTAFGIMLISSYFLSVHMKEHSSPAVNNMLRKYRSDLPTREKGTYILHIHHWG